MCNNCDIPVRSDHTQQSLIVTSLGNEVYLLCKNETIIIVKRREMMLNEVTSFFVRRIIAYIFGLPVVVSISGRSVGDSEPVASSIDILFVFAFVKLR